MSKLGIILITIAEEVVKIKISHSSIIFILPFPNLDYLHEKII